MTASSNTAFLKHYSEAREIAAQNTIIRLIYCAYNDHFISPDAVTFKIREHKNDKQFVVQDMHSAVDYMYSREPDQPLTIEMTVDGNTTVVSDPSEFLSFLKPHIKKKLAGEFDEDHWKSMHHAMMEGLSREALSVAKRIEIKEQLEQKTAHHASTWEWMISAFPPKSEELQTFFYQLGSFSGSQHHPLSKLRRYTSNGKAIDANKQMQYFAEYAHDFPLPVLAVSKQCMQVFKRPDGQEYNKFFEENYPGTYKRWESHLADAGKKPDDYYPIPIHPLNLKPMKTHLAQWVGSGDILETPAFVDVYPNISTRSLRLKTGAGAHIKTTMPEIQLTGHARLVPFNEVSVAPRFAGLVKEIVAENHGFGNTLRIVNEPYGFYFTPPSAGDKKEDNGFYLSGLLREDPQALVSEDEYSMPLATALSNVGKDGKGHYTTLLADMMRSNGVTDVAAAKDYFRQYARTVLTGQLAIFARDGVVLEAHQQNTSLVFDKKATLKSTIVQDIVSNTWCYAPILKCNKKYNELPKDIDEDLNHTPEELNTAIQLFIHTTLKSHLIPVLAIICREYGADKTEMLQILKGEVQRGLENAVRESEHDLTADGKAKLPEYLKAIEKGLLQDPTVDKAMMTMLLTHTESHIGSKHNNVLAVA
jgi:siderophore synthetase component